jgi:hypothetical protein
MARYARNPLPRGAGLSERRRSFLSEIFEPEREALVFTDPHSQGGYSL